MNVIKMPQRSRDHDGADLPEAIRKSPAEPGAAAVVARLDRPAFSHADNSKLAGKGFREFRIRYAPGYQDNDGGTAVRQSSCFDRSAAMIYNGETSKNILSPAS